MTQKSDEPETFESDLVVLLARYPEACARAGAEEAAREWVAEGFDDAEEVAAWLDAGCLEAADARRLDDAGLTPEQAALRTSAGGGGAEDTLGRKLARGKLSLEEARRIITREFWDD